MPSFEIAYDAEEDSLEATFDAQEEVFSRTIPLNDHIVLYTDQNVDRAWGLAFFSYSRLLLVSETQFTAIQEWPEEDRLQVLRLLSNEPAGLFFDITDPEALIARVRAPRLSAIIGRED
jgi:hypothetical protein